MTQVTIDIGIRESARNEIANELGVLLADTYTLYLKTHGYHWNVTGPMFQTLHNLFEEHYQELWAAVDDIAERIRALGAPAPAGYKAFSERSNVAEGDQTDAMAMVKDLFEGHETVARTIRSIWPLVEENHDEATIDLLTSRIAVHEKTAWMLRSMLE